MVSRMRSLMKVNWTSSAEVNTAHALALAAQGVALGDATLGAAFRPLGENLRDQVAAAGGSLEVVLGHLVPLAGQTHGREFAATICRRALGGSGDPERASALHGLWREALDRYQSHGPHPTGELLVEDSIPRSHWLTHGDEFVTEVIRRTEPETFPDSARVYLVPSIAATPTSQSFPEVNTVVAEFSEVPVLSGLPPRVELGWLLCHMNLDLPRYRDDLGLPGGSFLPQLALVPVALAAGEAVGWCVCLPQTVEEALERWTMLANWLPDDRETLSSQLWVWWEVYRERQHSWTSGLRALSQMMSLGQ